MGVLLSMNHHRDGRTRRRYGEDWASGAGDARRSDHRRGPYSPAIFELALDFATELPLESLITHTFPLERYAHAFDLLAAGPSGQGYGAMKILLVSNEEEL